MPRTQRGVSVTGGSVLFLAADLLRSGSSYSSDTPMPTFHVNHEVGVDLLPYAELFSIRGRPSKDKQVDSSQRKG